MSRYNRKKMKKIMKTIEKRAVIPYGCYCYGWDIGRCPHWEARKSVWVQGYYEGEFYREKVHVTKCRYLNLKEVAGFYLWDQVKCCGINDEW